MSDTVSVGPRVVEQQGAAMSVREVERAAVRLLSSSWWSTPFEDSSVPVDPFTIADTLGISVRRVSLPLDESGNIVFAPDKGPVISLNRGDSRARQRFTCAHEIGHYY